MNITNFVLFSLVFLAIPPGHFSGTYTYYQNKA